MLSLAIHLYSIRSSSIHPSSIQPSSIHLSSMDLAIIHFTFYAFYTSITPQNTKLKRRKTKKKRRTNEKRAFTPSGPENDRVDVHTETLRRMCGILPSLVVQNSIVRLGFFMFEDGNMIGMDFKNMGGKHLKVWNLLWLQVARSNVEKKKLEKSSFYKKIPPSGIFCFWDFLEPISIIL